MKNFTEEDIITYENFFDQRDFKSISNYLNRPMWKWGTGSLPDGHPDKPDFATPFWKMDLSKEYFFTDYLFNIIMEKTNQKYDITRCYCNGHTHGTSGVFHEDWLDSTGRTVLLYANDTWKQEWGGGFTWNGKTYYAKPGSFYLFDPRVPHRADDILCDEKRIAIDYTVRAITYHE